MAHAAACGSKPTGEAGQARAHGRGGEGEAVRAGGVAGGHRLTKWGDRPVHDPSSGNQSRHISETSMSTLR
jgi:hypothetical protein